MKPTNGFHELPTKVVTLSLVKAGTHLATHAVADPAGTDNFYVAEMFGQYKKFNSETNEFELIADLEEELNLTHAEYHASTGLYDDYYNGLLSIAVPTDFETANEYYVSYSVNPDGLSASEQSAMLNACGIDATSCNHLDTIAHCKTRDCSVRDVLFQVCNPGYWHNGGEIILDEDEQHLYFAIGDAGGRWDHSNIHTLNPGSGLGSIMRIDLNSPLSATPLDNFYCAKSYKAT